MLDALGTPVAKTRLSKKEPLSDAEVQELLKSVEEVVLGKGKSARTLKAKETQLDDLRGPTGNFRAPLLKVGKRLLVGFHEETLRASLGQKAP